MRDLGIKSLTGIRKFHSKAVSLGRAHDGDPVQASFAWPREFWQTLCLQNMKENHYRGVFKEIYLWSPPSRLDSGWSNTFEYRRLHLGQDPDSTDPKDQCVFDSSTATIWTGSSRGRRIL